VHVGRRRTEIGVELVGVASIVGRTCFEFPVVAQSDRYPRSAAIVLGTHHIVLVADTQICEIRRGGAVRPQGFAEELDVIGKRLIGCREQRIFLLFRHERERVGIAARITALSRFNRRPVIIVVGDETGPAGPGAADGLGRFLFLAAAIGSAGNPGTGFLAVEILAKNKVHHPAHGVRAINRGGTVGENIHARQRAERDHRQIDEIAAIVGGRDAVAVDENERRVAAQAAQVYARPVDGIGRIAAARERRKRLVRCAAAKILGHAFQELLDASRPGKIDIRARIAGNWRRCIGIAGNIAAGDDDGLDGLVGLGPFSRGLGVFWWCRPQNDRLAVVRIDDKPGFGKKLAERDAHGKNALDRMHRSSAHRIFRNQDLDVRFAREFRNAGIGRLRLNMEVFRDVLRHCRSGGPNGGRRQ
jgi:hypothetical protein